MKKAKKKSAKKKGTTRTGNDSLDSKKVDLVPAIPLTDTALVPFDPLQIYLMEIKRYDLLSREEERNLAIKVREHRDDKAAYRLITANLRLVVKIALDFHRYWKKS